VKLSHFFIDRPIFAAAVSVVITLTGLLSYLTLPVDQYPQIAPPTVSVTALYPGATAEEIADTVAAPLEQQINGIANMLYMSSSSTSEGRVSITVTFQNGTNIDIAQVDVQNRIQSDLPQLPQEVRDLGIHGEGIVLGFHVLGAGVEGGLEDGGLAVARTVEDDRPAFVEHPGNRAARSQVASMLVACFVPETALRC
jgi:hypothetical protein